MSFTSDFSLFPIKKLGNPKFVFRKATWPANVDPEVHDLIDGKSNDPIYYNRVTVHQPRTQYCKISKQANDIIVEPGEGFNYIVRKDSTNNKIEEIDDTVVPHDMKCVICLSNKRTHAVKECGHVVMCVVCAKQQYEANGECPICRTEMLEFPIKLFFA